MSSQTAVTKSQYVLLIFLSIFVSQSICFNALFISIGFAGHVTPMFGLAKTMTNHNITFLTLQSARVYIDLNSSHSPLFHVIYANDSADAFFQEKDLEQKINLILAKNALFEVSPKVISLMGGMIIPLLHKAIDILTNERFDVIVAGKAVFGISVLCERISTPCVIQTPSTIPNILDLNLPNAFALLTSKELSQLTYRIYNLAFTTHLAIRLITQLTPVFYTIFQSLPQIPGPFYDTFTLRNFLFSKSKCLNLVSMPSYFHTPSYSHHYRKYLGAFVDETLINDTQDALTTWVKSKPISSTMYGAFGSTSIIPYDRMYNLINGLAAFLIQAEGSFLLLALRSINYDTYQTVLKDLPNDEFQAVLANVERVRIESGFVKQKWILQQTSMKIFLSHCGMGSIQEGLYFNKSILCMPFNMDQFSNAISIENLNVGQSLFTPPPLLQSLLDPYNFVNYTFTAESVTSKMMTLWMDTTYEKAARRMSFEMKHAGGLKRAVEEIEFFVNLDGDLDRFAPFQSTLWFYQRYMLDLWLVVVILPALITVYIVLKCYKRQQKAKKD